MNTFTKITALSICTALTPVTTALANDETAAVMDEIFEVMWASAGTAKVGEKIDSGRSTRWTDVVISNGDEGPIMNLPWIEVSKKLLGGYVVTTAPKMTITGALPDGEGEISGALTHTGMEMTVDGAEGARSFDASFGQVDMNMTMGDIVNMTMSLRDGSAQTQMDDGIMTGSFDYPTISVRYGLDIEGQNTDTEFAMAGTKGSYRSPVLKSSDMTAWQSLWAEGSNFFVDYEAESMTMKMVAPSPSGNVNIDATGGAMSGRMAAVDGVVSSGGKVADLTYNVAAMGMPPMKVKIDQTDSMIAMPLDNVNAVKPAQMKMSLSGLELDPMIWAMFDPQGLLPKDKADLEIDVSGDVKWAQKMADIDPASMATGMPIQFENAKITALNLKALGATLKTTGAFDIDSSKFPPAASGQADIAITGVDALMGKLTEAGLLPQQNAMMAKGMMGMFFKPGGGADELTSQIVVSPDGSISANGFPLK